jgi:hypothetical protein
VLPSYQINVWVSKSTFIFTYTPQTLPLAH